MTQASKNKNNIDMSARIDERKWAVQFVSRIWLMLVITVAGALAGMLIYIVYTSITNGQTKYQIKTDYYITFNEKEYPNGMDYYNAFTWGQFVLDDRILDTVMDNLASDVDETTVKQCVTSEMLGDYRLLTIVVTSTEPGYAEAISEAYKTAMPDFSSCIPEIYSIEVWSCDDMVELKENTKTLNAGILGAIIALVLSCTGFAIYYTLDDKIYTQADVKGYLGDIPFIGYKDDSYEKEYEANLKKLTQEKKVETIIASSNLVPTSKSCILEVPMGKIRATQLIRRVDFLKIQDCKICGIAITECDKKFLKRYYR